MRLAPRPDDFAARREHLRALSDDELHAYFWELANRIVAPLVEEARTHTSPAIERSVLARMGLSSLETQPLVKRLAEQGLLGRGAGRIVAELAEHHGVTPREAAQALLAGQWWEEVQRDAALT
jgi:D-ornithine 4,5-aminomutase subunit alpha